MPKKKTTKKKLEKMIEEVGIEVIEDIIKSQESEFKPYELNEEHFEEFKEYCGFFLNVLNLNDWRAYFDFKNEEDSLASCMSNIKDRLANINLSKTWDVNPSKQELQAIALHEVLHVFFARLTTPLKTCLSDEYIGEIEHSMINALVTFISGLLEVDIDQKGRGYRENYDQNYELKNESITTVEL